MEKYFSLSAAPVRRWFIGMIPKRSFPLGLCVLTCSLSLGCVAAALPVKTSTRISGTSGSVGSTDLSFIRVGVTGRSEVAEKLGWTDTGVKEESLFVGHWASSTWGTAYFAQAGFGGAAGLKRNWKTHDSLIEFDEKGVVKKYGVFEDSELVNQLSAWIAEGNAPPLDLSTPIEISVEHYRANGKNYEAKLVLGKDSFRLTETGNTPQDLTISPAKISKFDSSRQASNAPTDPQGIRLIIQLTEKTKIGQKLILRVDVPAIVILVKYLIQTRV